ncbi:thermonuclease family protein [Gracilibacillus sp. YIM 98692]|uniref:thermonuclease family protein n=1 Tax=Gracilibacillus sp. YIM 98692 TaxID=2663532 RepID=UPI001F088E2E|nr:thermonuclease family protein [Gracilibacillus sp. YIM 98692]
MFQKSSLWICYFIIMVLISACGTGSPSVDEEKHQIEEDVQLNQQPDQSDVTDNTNASEKAPNAMVTRIVDGDTVKVQYQGEEETVRLLLVDTPETKHPDMPIQPYGPEASKFAEKTLAGEEIYLEFDGPKRDHYDRLLAYIWINEQLFNQMLLEEGLARYAYVYDPPYTHSEELMKAQNRAKDAEKGIWSINGYVTDEGFQAEPNQNETQDSTDHSEDDEVYYQNCSEARDAGVTPLYKGDPGYGTHMDGDGDGVACE